MSSISRRSDVVCIQHKQPTGTIIIQSLFYSIHSLFYCADSTATRASYRVSTSVEHTEITYVTINT
jgi:hypothetical protein